MRPDKLGYVINLSPLKLVFALAIFILLGFAFSTWKFQQLINEGSAIADEQCLKVNPLIIARKNSYMTSLKIAMASGSAEEYWAETSRYLDISKRYIAAQKAWLATQKTHIDNWGFNIFIPTYIKNGAHYQYNSREANVRTVKAMVELIETSQQGTLTSDRQNELSDIIHQELAKGRDADDAYNKIYGTPEGKFDLRNIFTTLPESKCPVENFNIPDVQDFLNPKSMPEKIGYPIS